MNFNHHLFNKIVISVYTMMFLEVLQGNNGIFQCTIILLYHHLAKVLFTVFCTYQWSAKLKQQF